VHALYSLPPYQAMSQGRIVNVYNTTAYKLFKVDGKLLKCTKIVYLGSEIAHKNNLTNKKYYKKAVI
jgi:hypothetical protein